uniref:Uncharacterized protein n=1 Tax=Globodera rostochiensis TaxID=31243 RepID=A0A914HIX3_GLORO
MTSSINYGFFGLKIRNIHKMVEINLPTWKLPYFIYLENRKELEQENALDLLGEAVEKNNFPVHEAIELTSNFVLEKQKFCDEKPQHFRDNMLRYAHGIQADIDPQKELQQIISAIIEELEEMLQNGTDMVFRNVNGYGRITDMRFWGRTDTKIRIRAHAWFRLLSPRSEFRPITTFAHPRITPRGAPGHPDRPHQRDRGGAVSAQLCADHQFCSPLLGNGTVQRPHEQREEARSFPTRSPCCPFWSGTQLAGTQLAETQLAGTQLAGTQLAGTQLAGRS